MITQEYLHQILDYDPLTGKFVWKVARARNTPANTPAGTVGTRGWVRLKIKGKGYSGHRLAWLYVYGEWPAQELDHIDRNRSNNAIANLRLSNRSQQMLNGDLRSDNTTGVIGVSPAPYNKFKANIAINKKFIHLGTFATIEEAAKARKAAEEAFGLT